MNYPSNLRFSYSLTRRFGSWRHSYVIEGAPGAIEFHVTENDNEERAYGGLEMHRATPGEKDGPPDHAMCLSVSFRPCWHDGTSLYADERLIPRWESSGYDRDDTFAMLLSEYNRRFKTAYREN